MSRSTPETSPESVVVSGAGLITSLGLDAETTWRNICAGKSGIRPLDALEQAPAPDKGGGQAVDLPEGWRSGDSRESRYLSFAVHAALRDAGLDGELPCPPVRCGVLLGSTLHGMRAAGRRFRSGDAVDLRSFLAPAVIGIALREVPVSGMALTTCAACASGLAAIAMGTTLLRAGAFDLIVAGGYDVISEYAYAGFNSLRLVAGGPMRPFCRTRDGMKVGEGYGVVILEREVDTNRRRQRPLVRLRGFGETADAHHLTHPHPEGDGAARAIRTALQRANLTSAQIDLITAHATSTIENDASESAALKQAFGDSLNRIPIVAFKSHIGHTLGGAGAIELILTALALRDGTIPPTANVSEADLEYPELRVRNGSARRGQPMLAMTLSLGFGGANCCAILERPARATTMNTTSPHEIPTAFAPTRRAVGGGSATEERDREVVITGVGIVAPGAIGNASFRERLCNGSPSVETSGGAIESAALDRFLTARRVRRMSEYSKLTLAATSEAWRHAGLADDPAAAESCHAILGAGHGSAKYSADFYRQIVTDGIDAANPMLFAEGVPNCGAAHVSLMLGLKGSCQTIIGSRTSALEAIALASARIRSGEWERAIVSAAEEAAPLVIESYRHCGLCVNDDNEASMPGGDRGHASSGEDDDAMRSGFVLGPAGGAVILESRRSAEARGATIFAAIAATAMRFERDSNPRRVMRAVMDVLASLGPVDCVIGSGNNTWIDLVEAAAIRALGLDGNEAMTTPYGLVPECFSVMPLAGIASVALAAGSNGHTSRPGADMVSDRVDERRVALRIAVIATDYSGLVAGVRLELEATPSSGDNRRERQSITE